MKKIFALSALCSLILAGCAGLATQSGELAQAGTWKSNAKISGTYAADLAVRCQNGTFVGRQDSGIEMWLGIPYAQAPMGELRFKKPCQAKPDSAVYEAFEYGPTAYQFGMPANVRIPESEDCLYLNVSKSLKDKGKKGLPVMVWIHGGGFNGGSGSESYYDGRRFLMDKEGVIFVTINYRLGPLGFLYLDGQKGGQDYPEAANLGLLDQAMALRWIKDNIGAFGGDPGNVTIFGESAGAASVSLQCLVRESKGCFNRIIAESGNCLISQSKDFARALTSQLFAAAGINDVSELRKMPVEEIKAAYSKVNHMCLPTRDGVVLPENMEKALAETDLSSLSAIIGTNAEEDQLQLAAFGGLEKCLPGICNDWQSFLVSARFSLEDWKSLQNFLRPDFRPELEPWEKILQVRTELFFRLPSLNQALAMQKGGAKVFVYYFKQPLAKPAIAKACHASEIPYVLNCESFMGNYSFDENLRGLMRQMWFNFATTGNPSAEELAWPPYNAATRPTMVFSHASKVENDPQGEQRILIEPLLKYPWETTDTYGSFLDFWLKLHRKF